MAWYRCGGGGLPAGLQSDMDTVLNKKFSTSTTYPPTDWPDTVNLMGPLPEKTASGAIANITDGADGVPLKNWLVTLPASLDGYSEVDGVKSKKNVVTLSDDYYNSSQRCSYTYENGGVSVSASGTYARLGFLFTLKAGVPFNISFDAYGDGDYCRFYLSESAPFSGQFVNIGLSQTETHYSRTFTLSGTALYIGLYVTATGTTGQAIIKNLQLEVGSTETAYEQYQAQTTYTASLGRTIYGGQADIVTGEGEDENGNAFTFTPITADTELGVNNFWADEGDSDVTYRADISLALQALGGGGRGLMMMRPTEPEETEETEETEGLEDELNR